MAESRKEKRVSFDQRARTRQVCDGNTYGSTGDVDPHVPMSQDRFRGLLKIPSGGPDDEGGRVLGGEHGLGIHRFKRIPRVLQESHGEERSMYGQQD